MNKLQKKNLTKHFNRYSDKYEVYTRELNEFKELSDEILVREISGIYYSKNSGISTKTDKAGITKTKKRHLIQTLDIEKINEDMYIYIKDIKYKIIDIENEAGLSLSYILTLEES